MSYYIFEKNSYLHFCKKSVSCFLKIIDLVIESWELTLNKDKLFSMIQELIVTDLGDGWMPKGNGVSSEWVWGCTVVWDEVWGIYCWGIQDRIC